MGIEAHEGWPPETGRRRSLLGRLGARLGGAAPPAQGFAFLPDTPRLGSFARGKQMVAGNVRVLGQLFHQPGRGIWDLDLPEPRFAQELHSFGWLDDLGAAGGGPARKLAQETTHSWIARFGDARQASWLPAQTGRRLICWITHAPMLMSGKDAEGNAPFFQSMADQARFLSRSWQAASAGLPRFQALTGLLYAGLCLDGLGSLVSPANAALSQTCAEQIDRDGAISSRNPEELLEVFTLLSRAADLLDNTGRQPSGPHQAALKRLAPVLQALRHSDGGLARFHGGGRGAEGQLEQLLDRADPIPLAQTDKAMGYARLDGGESTVIVDAAAPPRAEGAFSAHASTLGFELTWGRQPLIVSCGAGGSFGPDWRRAGRATPSHSTLSVSGVSSAQLQQTAEGEKLISGPKQVDARTETGLDGMVLEASHDGYRRAFGLTHTRQLQLGHDGQVLSGKDTLGTRNQRDKDLFDTRMNTVGFDGVGFAIRFHLHPDVEPSLDMGGTAISLTLKTGEVWVFRTDDEAEMSLEASVYLEKTRLKPRPSQQIVLSSRVMEYGAHVSWSLGLAKGF